MLNTLGFDVFILKDWREVKMITALGRYSKADHSIHVEISPTKIVILQLGETQERLVDGVRYKLRAEIEASYNKQVGARYTITPQQIVESNQDLQDYAEYQGVIRINELVASIQEKYGELVFYRGDAFPTDLTKVDLYAKTGWVTIAMPRIVSPNGYSTGDLVYVVGKIYHKIRQGNYEVCVRAEHSHKIDGTDYWEGVRIAHLKDNKN